MQGGCNQQTESRQSLWLQQQQLRFQIQQSLARREECWTLEIYHAFLAIRLYSGKLLQMQHLPQKWLSKTTIKSFHGRYQIIADLLALGSAVKAMSIALFRDWNKFMRWVSPDVKIQKKIRSYDCMYLKLYTFRCWNCIRNKCEMRKALCRPHRIIDTKTEV